MRSAIISACIFVLIIILVIFSYNYTDKITSQMVSSIEKSEEYVANNQWDKATDETKHFKELWNSKSDFIEMFFDHENSDSIDYEIINMENIVKNHNFTEFPKSSQKVKYMLKSLIDMQKVSFFNLF